MKWLKKKQWTEKGKNVEGYKLGKVVLVSRLSRKGKNKDMF